MGLAGELDRSCLADDGNLDLSWVFELVFDTQSDVACLFASGEVAHFVWFHEYSHFTTG